MILTCDKGQSGKAVTLRLPGTFERIGEPALSEADAAKLEAAGKVVLGTVARAEIARAVMEFPHNRAAPLATKVAAKLEAVGAAADRLLCELAKLATSKSNRSTTVPISTC